MEPLKCVECGALFELSEDRRRRYPKWKPKVCLACYTRARQRPELNLSTDEVLQRFTKGPNTGLFTDGSCEHNPNGPGGWGAVRVRNGVVMVQKCGHSPETTSNRMELTALIEAYKMLAPDEEAVVYTDNRYGQNIASAWARTWKRNGWTRGKKHEPVENLDLVQELYALVEAHPLVRVEWQRGHDGCRWNEYADSLSTAYTRDSV